MKLDETPIGRGLHAAVTGKQEIRLRSSLGAVLWINEEALNGLVKYAVDLGWKLPLLTRENNDGD